MHYYNLNHSISFAKYQLQISYLTCIFTYAKSYYFSESIDILHAIFYYTYTKQINKNNNLIYELYMMYHECASNSHQHETIENYVSIVCKFSITRY